MNHYLMAGRLVAAKLTSWEDLEHIGKAKPSKRVAPFQSAAAKWFLENNNNKTRKEK